MRNRDQRRDLRAARQDFVAPARVFSNPENPRTLGTWNTADLILKSQPALDARSIGPDRQTSGQSERAIAVRNIEEQLATLEQLHYWSAVFLWVTVIIRFRWELRLCPAI
jgi:hypothetical protein